MTKSQGLIINMITPDTTSINMYSNGQYNPSFILQKAAFNCSMNKIYTYSQTSQQHESNTPYTF